MSENEVVIPLASAVGRSIDENFNILIWGDHGGGKTSWIEEVLIKNKRRLIVLDTLCKDYGNDAFCASNGVNYDGVYYDKDSFFRALAGLVGTDKRGGFRLVSRCPLEEQIKVLDLLKYRPEKKSAIVTDCVFVIEESNFFMTSSYIEPALRDHFQVGRHNRNSLICVARYPYEMNSLARSQADCIISFRQREKNAIKFFGDIDSEKALELRDLKQGDFRIFTDNSRELSDFIKKE